MPVFLSFPFLHTHGSYSINECVPMAGRHLAAQSFPHRGFPPCLASQAPGLGPAFFLSEQT